MNSFTLNHWKLVQSFSCISYNSEFLLIKIIVSHSTHNFNKEYLQQQLSGFYLEIEEIYEMDNDFVCTRSRPFELSKEIDLIDNSIIFNRCISKELFKSEDSMVFYNKLNVKLISRSTSKLIFPLRSFMTDMI